MGVIIGVIVGYVMGARAGERGVDELKEAWATIRTSEEARALAAGGLSVALGLIGRGSEMLSERLSQQADRGDSRVATLRPTG